MSHLSPDFLEFFKELAPNNNKDWFDENRARYHENIKKPFEDFVTAVINEMRKTDDSLNITYKDCIFRINRDVRFSKDKSPYKLNRSALISNNGKKEKTIPGLYFELSPEHARVYSGVYQPDKDQLYALREEITENGKEFEKIISEKKFVELFGEIQGDKNARLPKEFQKAAEKQPLLFNKQFYVYTTFEPEEILKEGFEKKIVEAYKIAEPFAKFLSKPILNLKG
jgi:uncharacterized protein (TIGR02453 family)